MTMLAEPFLALGLTHTDFGSREHVAPNRNRGRLIRIYKLSLFSCCPASYEGDSWENVDQDDGSFSTFEIGMAFQSELEFRDSPARFEFGENLFIRIGKRF